MEIKSKNHALILLILGTFLFMTYKAWKFLGVMAFQIGPRGDYYEYQTYLTYYRIFASLMALGILYKCVDKFKNIFSLGSTKVLGLNLFFLILYFLFRYKLTLFDLYPLRETSFELFFNFFTGTFEEFVFTGMIFFPLTYFLSPFRAALITSVTFSLWHIDVTNSYQSLIWIALFSMYIRYSFVKGTSLISLALFHFLWDQIYFGFVWGIMPAYYMPALNALTVLMTFILMKKFSNAYPFSLGKINRFPQRQT